MSNTRRSRRPPKPHRAKLLTQLEKLDGRFSGLATETRMLLDQGVPASKVPEILREHYPAAVTKRNVSAYRTKRWKPQKEEALATFATLEAFFHKCGGNYGLDLAAFAKVRELLQSSDIKDANSVRLAVLKIRAQDLKEEEFKVKRSELEAGEPSDGEESDPDAQRRVLRRVKEIFGLASDEEEEEVETTSPEVPAAAGQESA